jgi:hypothetical protein
MRQQKLLVVLAGLAVVVAAGAVWLWPRVGQHTRENYERIVSGMTPGDVEATLGPPGDYRTGPTQQSGPTVRASLETRRERPEILCSGGRLWYGDSATIFVEINETGDILKEYTPCRRKGLLDTVLWRAKRQFRRWFPEEV